MTQPGDAKHIFAQSTYPSGRRSTRVEFVTPVILTGRGALGREFSEDTETIVVNLHGAKALTNNAIRVGAILRVKVVPTGVVADAICVWVGERVAGQTTHEIAFQLVKPTNIWGLENPPSDWLRPSAVRPQGIEPGGKPSSHESPEDAGLEATATATVSVARPSQELAEAARNPNLAKAHINGHELLSEYEERLELAARRMEGRIQECADQALETLRLNIEALRANAMEEIVNEEVGSFQNKIDSISTDAEAQYTSQIQAATKNIEGDVKNLQSAVDAVLQNAHSSLEALRADGMEEIVNRAVRSFQSQIDSTSTDAEARYAGRRQEVTKRYEADLKRSQSAMANEMTQRSLQEFRQNIDAILKDAESGAGDRVGRALEDLSGALDAIRKGFEAELSAQSEQAVRSAERSIRSRVASLLSALNTNPDEPASKTPRLK